MADVEEHGIGGGGEQLSYSDRKRRLFLILSTLLLMAAMCVALVLKTTLFTNPWIAISAFFLPAIECQLALLYLNQIRRPVAFLLLALALSFSTILLALALERPINMKALAVICCVNMVWGGLFQMGLNLFKLEGDGGRRPLCLFTAIYLMLAPNFIGPVVKAAFEESGQISVWVVAYPVVLGLAVGMGWLQAKAADGSRRGGAE